MCCRSCGGLWRIKLTRVSMGYLTDTPSGRLKTTMVERVEQMESHWHISFRK